MVWPLVVRFVQVRVAIKLQRLARAQRPSLATAAQVVRHELQQAPGSFSTSLTVL